MSSRLVSARLAGAHAVDKWVLAPIVGLLMLGTVMIYSSTFAEAFLAEQPASYYIVKHLQWLLIGLLALVVCSRIDYRRWRRLSVPLMGVALLALVIVIIAPRAISPEIWGARRWIVLGPLQAQPSEFAKLALIIYAADWLSQKGEKVRNLWYGLIPFGIILGVLVGLIMLEPDLGTSTVVVIIGMAMFFVAGAHLLQLFGGLGLAAMAFSVLVVSASYRMNRLSIFLDPWRDPDNLGYHPIQSLLAFGSGGFAGLGLGVSRQKFSWLPAAHTDSILAVIGEELGFVGSVLVLILVLAVAVRGYSLALRAPDAFGALLATGITTWIAGQASLNIAVNTLTVPFTGIPLPFVSYGGSSLVVLLAAVGVLLNVSRYAREPEERREKTSRPARRRLRPGRGREVSV